MMIGEAKAKLDAFGIDAVCGCIADGESMTGTAEKIGVSFGSLSVWINADPERSARVREVRALTARAWDEKAERGIESAKDQFELQKAKELAHHYRWRSTKIAPRDYGDKLAVGQADDLAPLAALTDDQLDARIKALTNGQAK